MAVTGKCRLVGADALIGSSSPLLCHVHAGVVMVGNPARRLER